MIERHGNFDHLFTMLEELKDQQIMCIYSEIGSKEYQGVRSTLKNVIPYDSIMLELRDTISFVGERNAIVLLATEIDGQMHTLYKNADIPKIYPGYSTDPFGLISIQKEHLGYSVREEQLLNTMNGIEERKAKEDAAKKEKEESTGKAK